jgi:phytoene dehydrogenase-like protein
MNSKKIIIVGAGITGLSAGTYLSMNGYDVEIFELHSISGGLCTAWKRKEYIFDGCIHWLCGSSPKDELYTIWEELGAIQDKTIVDHEMFVHNYLDGGRTFSVYCDTSKLREEMLRYAPEDKKLIEDFVSTIEAFKKIKMPVLKPQELFTLLDSFKFAVSALPILKSINKFNKLSLLDFQNQFTNPFFKQNFLNLFGMYGEMPVTALIYTLALLSNKAAGYPIGGSLDFIKSIEDKYKNLGGKINYNCKVEKILVEDATAKGIRLSDGREFFGDIIISAADGHYTIYDMLDGKYIDEEIEGYYKNFKLFPSIIQVSLGVNKKFDQIPSSVTYNYQLKKSIKVDPSNSISDLAVKIYEHDKTIAPQGKTVITTLFNADYDYWLNLKKDNPAKYKLEKDRIAAEFIAELDDNLGGIKDKVEVFDVATPHTFIRYTNNWKASFEGFIPTVENFSKKLKKTLPGLNNFYMIGQWLQPGGGLPTGGMHGRHLAMTICKKDRKKFEVVK